MFYLRRVVFGDYLCQIHQRFSFKIFFGDFRHAVSFSSRDDARSCLDFVRKADFFDDEIEIVKITEEVSYEKIL